MYFTPPEEHEKASQSVLTPRYFMKLVLTLLYSLCLVANAAKPNIVFIFVDDWGRHASAYAKLDGPGTANDVLQTTHFDRVAAEGLLFRNAFVSSPSCTPCRSSLFSGKHFWETGSASILWSTWDASLPSFPMELVGAGYHMGKSYKGWGPGKPYEAPFGGKANDYQQAGGRFGNFSQYVTAKIRKGTETEQAKQALYDEFQGNFAAFLKDRPEGAPFFYYTGPTNTHRKWTKGSGKNLWGIDPDSLKGKLPPFLPDVAAVRQDFADYLGEVMAVDAGIGVIYEHLLEIGELENTILVISGDHGAPGFPYGKTNLYDFGTRVPLAIRIGKNTGITVEPGRVVDRLTSLIDIAPTLLDAAAADIPEAMTGKSLLTVFADESLSQSDDEAVYIGRERHFTSARDGNVPYPQRAIRTKEFLFIMNFIPDRWPAGDPRNLSEGKTPTTDVLENDTGITLADEDAGPTKAWLVEHRADGEWEKYYDRAYGKRPARELYSLTDDPYNLTNLAGKQEMEIIQASLEARLLAELKRTGDPRLTGDGQYYEKPPMAGPNTGR